MSILNIISYEVDSIAGASQKDSQTLLPTILKEKGQ